MEKELTAIEAVWSSRKSKEHQSYCIDMVMCFDLQNLPPQVKTDGKKAWIFVKGNDLPKLPSIKIKYWGYWEFNSAYGMQFKAVSYEVKTPKTSKGIVSYLSSQLFRGVGKRNAEKLVKKFGDNTIKVIEESPEEIFSVVSKEIAEKIIKGHSLNSGCQKLFDTLGKYGISQNMVIKIYEKFGADARNIITYNPYKLQEVNVPFKVCDKIAIDGGFTADSYERIQGNVCYAVKQAENLTGDTYFDANAVKKEVMKYLNQDKNVVSEKRFDEMFEKIKKNHDGIVVRKFPDGNSYVSSRSLDYAEYETSRKLIWLAKAPVSRKECEKIDNALVKYCSASEIALSEKQQEAVKQCLKSHVSIITGGPGTGKTTIIKAIIAVYETVFKAPVTLMAPTGKAARRMTEATGRNASTIHSRLGIYELENEKTEVMNISDGLIIIDEVSMLDMLVMQKVCEAVTSDRCHVVFVGDVDQLPSVGAGSVLSQMIESGVIPTSRLTEIFRQKDGGVIVKNAIRINYGKTSTMEFNDNDFVFHKARNEKEAAEIIVNLYKEETKKVGVDNVALLCPLRRTQEGRYLCTSDGLNPQLQDAVNPKDNYSNAYKMANGREFRVNDRVLQWKNNKTSFNGDIGVIRDINESETGSVTFKIQWDNGNEVEVGKEEMNSVDLGYSMSIHKSQGSEYKSIIIPMLKDQERCPLFKRNLLYTGVTRAKQKVIIVGDMNTFNKCVMDDSSDKRRSFLANRLIANKG